MRGRNHWPLLILMLATGFIAFSAWSFYRAAQGSSAVTDTDYYSHGLRYNQTILERNAAASLGWDATVTLDDRQLQVVLTDRARQPVTAASVTLSLSKGNRGEALLLPLTEGSGGNYLVDLPLDLRGNLNGQLDFALTGTRFSKRLLISIP